MTNRPARNLKARQDIERKMRMTLDVIAQFRIRAQTAESFGLYRLATQARAPQARQEEALTQLRNKLAEYASE